MKENQALASKTLFVCMFICLFVKDNKAHQPLRRLFKQEASRVRKIYTHTVWYKHQTKFQNTLTCMYSCTSPQGRMHWLLKRVSRCKLWGRGDRMDG